VHGDSIGTKQAVSPAPFASKKLHRQREVACQHWLLRVTCARRDPVHVSSLHERQAAHNEMLMIKWKEPVLLADNQVLLPYATRAKDQTFQALLVERCHQVSLYS